METSRKPLSIAHVDTESGFSGGQIQVLLLMKGLQERGHRCVLFGPQGSELSQRATSAGIETRSALLRNDLDMRGVARLAREFARLAPDAGHLHTGRATWLGSLAARRVGCRALPTRRMDRRVKPGLRTRWIYTRGTQRAAAISQAVADCLRAGGVASERIELIPSSIDPEAVVPQRPREHVRAEQGADGASVVLLSLASMHSRKGLDVLLQAAAGLQTPGTEWLLWIAGSGPEEAALARQIEELGLGKRVSLLGQRPDSADLLSACDVFVLPSRREGLGGAALEAMAAGRPVVASAVGGLAEAVVSGTTGLLVPAEDPDALSQALGSLIQDPEKRRALGRAGPARIADRYLPEQMVRSYEALYRELQTESQG